MGFDPTNKHHRRSIRLRDYNYKNAGPYFVTICTFERQSFLGEVLKGEMQLSPFGQIAFDEWQKTAVVRQNVTIDEFIIMPNHIHGIIILNLPQNSTNDSVGACGSHAPNGMHAQQTKSNPKLTAPPSGSLGAIIAQYKSIVTKRIHKLHSEKIPVWQPNYYERIIRDDNGLNRARQYIIDNPKKWASDVNFRPNP